MNTTLRFDPATSQILGPGDPLAVRPDDPLAQRFLMLIEGQCLGEPMVEVAAKYGFSRQRYYQLLANYESGGVLALAPRKTGPKAPSRRTDTAVRLVLRLRFLDTDGSPAVIVQKIRQQGLPLSLRSVARIIADYGLQKKTPRRGPQPLPAAPAGAHAARAKRPAHPTRRSAQLGASDPGAAGA